MTFPIARLTTDTPESSATRSPRHGAADEPRAIALTALSLGRPRLRGPGLTATAPPTVLVSPVDPQGLPVTGLQRAAFAVQMITVDANRRFGARDVPIDAFDEVAAGIYALAMPDLPDASPPHALVVTVISSRTSGQGRALVRIDAQ